MANRNMKIESLQALRAIAFLGIFTSHSCWNSQLGALGVSVFFVLSGFLMTINYWDAKLDTSFRECFQFSWQKISRLYPLHILMLVVAIPFEFNRSISNDSVGIVYSFVKILSSVSLTQSWFPDFWIYGSFNGVAWFLSACMFLYLCFPVVLAKMKQVNSKMYGILLVEVYLLQVFFVYITRETTYGIYPDTNYWIAYIFPLTRLGDFIIGCYLGAIFRINRTKFSFSTGSFWEIITIILICISARQYINQNIFLGQNWFRYTCLWIPTSCLIVYLFACNQGIISKILSNKFFIWLGDISPYTFLIHNIIIVYVNMFVPEILKLFFDTSIINGIVLKIVNTFIAFGGSVMSAIIWKKYRNVIFGFCK